MERAGRIADRSVPEERAGLEAFDSPLEPRERVGGRSLDAGPYGQIAVAVDVLESRTGFARAAGSLPSSRIPTATASS